MTPDPWPMAPDPRGSARCHMARVRTEDCPRQSFPSLSDAGAQLVATQRLGPIVAQRASCGLSGRCGIRVGWSGR